MEQQLTSERWQQVKQIFQAALELEPDDRAAYLAEACAGDPALLTEVESLIAAHEEAGAFLDRPAVDLTEEPAANLAGSSLGRYQILALLGRGGMGEVYRAKDTTLGRVVAIKVLPSAFSIDRDRLGRFEQEARSASALNHPNIITIHEFGQEGSIHFIVSEFIEGQTLRQQLASGKLTLADVVEIAIQITGALNAAHEAGIVHRDIKPENVMVRPDGLVKILDFGLAKLTEEGEAETELKGMSESPAVSTAPTAPFTFSGVVMGTVNYMSPEQTRGQKLDARTDLFSLGVVIYEMVAGRSPFSRPTSTEVIAAIREQAPETLHEREAPAGLAQVIGRALRKEREERYQRAKDLLLDLKDLRHRLEFEAEPERSMRRSDDADPRRPAESPGAMIKRRPLGTALILILAVTLIATIIHLGWFTHLTRGAITSVAVLPFANETGDTGLEYLTDGISECLTDKLAQLPQLKVIAHTSSSRYRDKNADLQEVARALGVQAIVVGRVAKRGEELLINSELVDGRERTRMWGGMYKRRTMDLQLTQSEIARDIASELRIRLTQADEQQLAKHPTADPQAYDLVLKGRSVNNRGTAEGSVRALDYFQQAVAVDPNYALAQAELSGAYCHLACNGMLDPKETLPKARAAAARALDLDESLTEAHSAMAWIKMTDWDWAGAERSFKRAFELNPNSAEAHYGYARLLSNQGRHDQAIAEAKRAKELDPIPCPDDRRSTPGLPKELDAVSLNRNKQFSFILWAARRYDQAIEALRQDLRLNPNYTYTHLYLGYVYSAKRMFPEALAAYARANELGDVSTSTRCYQGYALAMAGQRREALAVLNELQTTTRYVSPAELAILYLGLGQKPQALRSLEKAYSLHDLQMQFLNADPHFDSLRGDARFQDLVLRVGLDSATEYPR
ncbi:MAG TPA: protein kinase [Blastocatellia bacterium]|nr:protein kinase [Blastocatellia bacterium]